MLSNRRLTSVLASALLLVAVLVMLPATPAAAAGFEDVGDSPYETSINFLAAKGIVGGYPDNTFRPDNTLWRAQFAKMAVLTMGLPVGPSDVSRFRDTPAIDPRNPLYPGAYVAVAFANNIVAGFRDGTFGFWRPVTRQQAITMVVRAAGDALKEAPAGWQGGLSHSDPTHGANIKRAEYNGLLAGIPDLPAWDTRANATRGETAEILAQLYYRTGAILTLEGPAGTQRFTASQLRELQSVQGYGGWKNRVGRIVGPRLYEGVPLQTLVERAGGGATVTVEAADGYRLTYTADDVAGRPENIFDPGSGERITSHPGRMTMILAFRVDGAPLSSAEGALRIGFVTPDAVQVTEGMKWVGQVIRITVE